MNALLIFSNKRKVILYKSLNYRVIPILKLFYENNKPLIKYK